jgi:hypothetical protein
VSHSRELITLNKVIDEILAENKVETITSVHAASHHDISFSDEEVIPHKNSGRHVVFSDEVDVRPHHDLKQVPHVHSSFPGHSPKKVVQQDEPPKKVEVK